MKRPLLWLALLWTLVSGGPALAKSDSLETEVQAESSKAEFKTAKAAAATDPLTLEQVLEIVETHHPKLQGTRLVRNIASAKVLEKRGAFDTNLALSTAYQSYNSSSEPGKLKRYFTNSISAYRTDPSGVKWEAGWLNNQGDIKQPQSSTGDTGELYIQAKVPLLRGLNINDKSIALRQSEFMVEQAEAEYDRMRLFTLLDAGVAYYNWVTAVIQLDVIRENLRLAEVRASQVKDTIEAGDRARIDQIEADREIAKREEMVIKAERIVAKHAFKLALYLWNSDGQSRDVPRAEDSPRSFPVRAIPTAEELARIQVEALSLRPELKRLKIQKSIVGLDRDLAVNQRLPQLDLSLRPGLDTGGQSVGFTFKAGIDLVIPLATRTADGREQAAALKLNKLGLDQVETVRRILLQIQDTASEIETSESRIGKALEVYRLAKQLEEAERTKFKFGDSSLFLVNSRERSTVDAALKVLAIRNERAQASLLLRAVGGSL